MRSPGGPNLLLSNLDTLHAVLLPGCAAWARILAGARLLVLDEAHAYRGLFGAHAALVLRRLARALALWGGRTARPPLLLCSATIANPAQHARQLMPRLSAEEWAALGEGGARGAARAGGARAGGASAGGESSAQPLAAQAPDAAQGGPEDDLLVLTAEDDGSAAGPRTLMVWQPARVDSPAPAEWGLGAEDSPAPAEWGLGAAELSPCGTSAGEERAEAPGCGGGSGEAAGAGARAASLPAAQAHWPSRIDTLSAAPSAGACTDTLSTSPSAGACADTLSAAHTHASASAASVRSGSPSNAAPPALDGGRAPRRPPCPRVSPLSEAARLLACLTCAGLRCLAFTRSRAAAEALLAAASARLPRALRGALASYRAGYTPADRRRIEAALFAGRLRCVVATCALELGLDVGSLDVVLCLGAPASGASLWQQAGRAGRGARPGAALLLPAGGPLDAAWAADPAAAAARRLEALHIAPGNPALMELHALCAAGEAPLRAADGPLFGAGPLAAAVGRLAAARALLRGADGLSWARAAWSPAAGGRARPPGGFSLRACEGPPALRLLSPAGALLGLLEESRAAAELHPGAVLLLQGAQYAVEGLDWGGRAAALRPCAPRLPYTTRALTRRAATPLRREASAGGVLHGGPAALDSTVVGFQRLCAARRAPLGPPVLLAGMPTLQLGPLSALWGDLPHRAAAALAARGLCPRAGCHAASHALAAVLPPLFGCERGDLLCAGDGAGAGGPRLLLLERAPGGMGILAPAFAQARPLLRLALQLLQRCACAAREGCLDCVQDAHCREGATGLDTAGAGVILQELLACLDGEGREEGEKEDAGAG